MYETREYFHPHDPQHAYPSYGEQGPDVYEAAHGTGFTPVVTHFDNTYPAPGMEAPASTWEFEQGLAQLLESSAEEPARAALHDEPAAVRPPVDRRRRRIRPRLKPTKRLGSLVIAALTAAIVAMMSVLGGVISYDPLCTLASPSSSEGLVGWWPLLVYGPWLAASLSILRAAVHRHPAVQSWVVVVLFSSIAVVLCIIASPRNVTGMAVAGLPPITALVSFHQLVRQITLIDLPRHTLPRQRGPKRRTPQTREAPMGHRDAGERAVPRR